MIKEICGKVSCDLCNIYSLLSIDLTAQTLEEKPLLHPICKSLDQIPQREPRQTDISAMISYIGVM